MWQDQASLCESFATGVILNDDTFKVIRKKDDLSVLHGGMKLDAQQGSDSNKRNNKGVYN